MAEPTRGVIDASILHSWVSPVDVFDYLSKGWRSYMAEHMPRPWHDHLLDIAPRPAGRLTSSPMSYDLTYHNPLGDYLPNSMTPDAFAAGSDLEVMRAQHLEPAAVELGLLCHGSGMLIPTLPVPRLTIEFCRAINDWTVDRWLSAEDRLLGTVLVPTQVPEAAAAEIRRIGTNSQMAAVLLGANGLGKPFGHPIYHPIYRAAEDLGLSIVIRAGGDQTMEAATYPAAAGLPATYSEFRVLAPQALITHAVSLIAQGVLDQWPSLDVLLLGGGITWITPFLWRLDTDYKAFRQSVLWLKSRPSEIFCERFFVGTDPFSLGAAVDKLATYLQIDHDLGEVICYGSSYPEREYTAPEIIEAAVPPQWRAAVLRENALRFLKRTTPSPGPNVAATSVALDSPEERLP